MQGYLLSMKQSCCYYCSKINLKFHIQWHIVYTTITWTRNYSPETLKPASRTDPTQGRLEVPEAGHEAAEPEDRLSRGFAHLYFVCFKPESVLIKSQ